jgi:GNAT superfamily N-acetyltransferase
MIKQMATDSEIRETFEVMKQLRSHLSEEQYLAAVHRQQETDNYHLAAVTDEGIMKCVAGYRLSESLSWGRFLYVDDLVTDQQARSENHGQRMMEWLVNEARKNGCGRLHLDSGVQRHSAHRFYLRERMDILCYHFGLAV